MLISVIVPVYKVEKYIHRCVDSILAQTFPDFEVILVDDGSPDGCGAVCESYAARDCRVHVIHRPNGGLSAARNSGIEWALAYSDSSWLTFIDSDDWVHPRFLEMLIHGVRTADAEVGMVGRQYVSEFDGAYPEYDRLPELVCCSGEELFLSREWDFNYAWGKLYRKEQFATLRYPEGKNFEDVFTTYQILFSGGKIALVDEPLYFYFRNEEGISHSAWKPGELVVLEGMQQQMAFYRSNGYARAYDKEERLYIHHHAYQLVRIRENTEAWPENRAIWYQLRRKMLTLMKNSGGKYTFSTMPYCREAAYPRLHRLKQMLWRSLHAWKRYGLRGIWKRIGEKLGG